MEINEAIQRTRKEAAVMRSYARHIRGVSDMFASHSECVAFALESVCDKLEEFLRKQEEDNSYHSR